MIAALRTAGLLLAASLLVAGCSSPVPGAASATPTPAPGTALRQELGTLQSCLETSGTSPIASPSPTASSSTSPNTSPTTSSSTSPTASPSTQLGPAAAICYEGFGYTLDGYTWPKAAAQEEALLRSSALALAQCLSGSDSSSCGTDLTAFTTAQNELLTAIP